MQADGRVNLLVELFAGFNIVRRKPAAHAFILQAFVQTVSKLLVLGGRPVASALLALNMCNRAATGTEDMNCDSCVFFSACQGAFPGIHIEGHNHKRSVQPIRVSSSLLFSRRLCRVWLCIRHHFGDFALQRIGRFVTQPSRQNLDQF